MLAHVITNALQERARADTSLATASLGDEVHERVRRIYYVRQQLNAEPSMQRRVRMVADQVRRTIGFDRAMLFMPEEGRLTLRSSYPAGAEGAIDIESDLFESEAFRTRHGVSVEQVDGRSPRLPSYEGLTSYVVVPVVRDDRSIGVLVGGFTGDRKVQASDLQLLQIFAGNVRAALDERAGDIEPPPGFAAGA